MAGLVTVTVNPAIDISTEVERVEPSRKLRCTRVRRDPGGGGINVARVASRLGSDVLAIYAAGGSPGRLLGELLSREGISSLPVEIAGETREDLTVFEASTGELYRFVLPGPEMASVELRRVVERVAAVASAPDYIVASGSLPPGAPDGFYAELAKLSKRLGSRFVLDTSGPSLRRALAEGVYLVKPSLRELSELVGRPLAAEGEWGAAAVELVERGKAEVVALTLGERGALLASHAGTFTAAGPSVQVASVVGAGDAFLGGMLSALLGGQQLLDAFRRGVAAGTATVQMPGTELCHKHDVMRLLQEVHAQKVQFIV